PYGGPWRAIADGITTTGIQMTWKQNDVERQGLLPDVFHLPTQVRDGPPINPGTVQTDAVRLFDALPVYSLHVVRPTKLLVHTPGRIDQVAARTPLPGNPRSIRVSFRITPWLPRRYYILVNGLDRIPQVRVNGVPITIAPPHQYLPSGSLVLQLLGTCRVELLIEPASRAPVPRR
ncbi:MAG: hypothetical protein ACP5RN_15450, partial [Armatimonadota bacterium]